MLGEAQHMDVGLAFVQRFIAAARSQETLEGASRVFSAEVACNRRLKFVGCHGAAPKPERLAHGRALRADEEIGLQPLDGRHRAGQ